MVANAIGRSGSQRNLNDEVALESGLRENITRQLEPLVQRLKNRWIILGLFVLAYIPFGLTLLGAYQDNNALQSRISAQQAVLALPEPRTDDIETGLRSWTAALEAATNARVLELPDSALVDRLVAASIGTGVTITTLATSENDIIPVGSEAYDVTPVVMRVVGDLAAIESFLAVLEGDAVEALEVQNSLLVPDGTSFSASVTALVFNRPVALEELDAETLDELTRRVSDAELDAAARGGR
jgi:hypothetical protein